MDILSNARKPNFRRLNLHLVHSHVSICQSIWYSQRPPASIQCHTSLNLSLAVASSPSSCRSIPQQYQQHHTALDSQTSSTCASANFIRHFQHFPVLGLSEGSSDDVSAALGGSRDETSMSSGAVGGWSGWFCKLPTGRVCGVEFSPKAGVIRCGGKLGEVTRR